MVHDPAYLDTLDASTGKGLPSFDVQRFAEYHKHASHHPSPLRPIQVGGRLEAEEGLGSTKQAFLASRTSKP